VISLDIAIQTGPCRGVRRQRRVACIAMLICTFILCSGGDAAAQSTSKLQTLLNDTVAQLQLAYRHNLPEQQRRYDELAQIVATWREAPRNDANNRLLEDWLRGAIRSSMPGSQQLLPAAPRFERPSALDMAVPAEQPVFPADQPAATIIESIARPRVEHQFELPAANDQETTDAEWEKSVGDPFADDLQTAE
jgi:hypothetical protein